MDYTSAMAELLSRHGFRRVTMSRSAVGHLKLAGHLGDRPIDIVLDTGASKTFVELTYCRSDESLLNELSPREFSDTMRGCIEHAGATFPWTRTGCVEIRPLQDFAVIRKQVGAV